MMEKALLRISPENLGTIALLSAFAYLGVVGAQKALTIIKSKTGL